MASSSLYSEVVEILGGDTWRFFLFFTVSIDVLWLTWSLQVYTF